MRVGSIEYWFRCMDLDGDGALSMFELDYFYEEQCRRLDGMGIEPLPFQDCLCQMLDLVQPQCPGGGQGRGWACQARTGTAVEPCPARPHFRENHAAQSEAVQDGQRLLRHLLQRREVPGPRAVGAGVPGQGEPPA